MPNLLYVSWEFPIEAEYSLILKRYSNLIIVYTFKPSKFRIGIERKYEVHFHSNKIKKVNEESKWYPDYSV